MAESMHGEVTNVGRRINALINALDVLSLEEGDREVIEGRYVAKRPNLQRSRTLSRSSPANRNFVAGSLPRTTSFTIRRSKEKRIKCESLAVTFEDRHGIGLNPY
jgi:hypothetical protein